MSISAPKTPLWPPRAPFRPPRPHQLLGRSCDSKTTWALSDRLGSPQTPRSPVNTQCSPQKTPGRTFDARACYDYRSHKRGILGGILEENFVLFPRGKKFCLEENCYWFDTKNHPWNAISMCWIQRKKLFHAIKSLPPSSVEAERAFSSSGMFVTKQLTLSVS